MDLCSIEEIKRTWEKPQRTRLSCLKHWSPRSKQASKAHIWFPGSGENSRKTHYKKGKHTLGRFMGHNCTKTSRDLLLLSSANAKTLDTFWALSGNYQLATTTGNIIPKAGITSDESQLNSIFQREFQLGIWKREPEMDISAALGHWVTI